LAESKYRRLVLPLHTQAIIGFDRIHKLNRV